MNLKKINPNLQKALVEFGLIEANELQQETFSAIKSGVDIVVQSDVATGKSTTIALNVIHKLEKPFELSPRALIFCTNKEAVLEMVSVFNDLNRYAKLRVFYTHEKTDLDDDKNQISIGIDVLIGTPNRLNEMFGGAGFDVNQLRMFVVDDVDIMLRNRFDAKITRISDSIAKTQRLFFCSQITEKVELLADKLLVEPLFFEFD